MAYSDYTAALTAFQATPSETAKRLVLTERAKLPDQMVIDGVQTTLPNIATLQAMLEDQLDGATSAGDPKRFIRTRTGHRG